MGWTELGQGLMIAGGLLVLAGFVGLALRRNKEAESNHVVLPGDAPWRGVRSDASGLNSEPKD